MIRWLWSWIGPVNRMNNPVLGGAICAGLVALGFAIAAPPVIWALDGLLGPWWRWWLP